MITIAETLYKELIRQISELDEEKDILIRTEKTVQIIFAALFQLKELIKREGFADEQEEIEFYKHIKPNFQALYIYHATLFNIESDKPIGSHKATHRYFHNELRRIDIFFHHNLEFYKYYRAGKTNRDKEYFTRGQGFTEFLMDVATPIIDHEFCTLHSLNLAFFIAYQQLRQYIQHAMSTTDTPIASPTLGIQAAPMNWTDSKTGLIELAYALHAAGVFNNGKADIKQITDFLEISFHIQLGNTSRTFQEILSRKRGHTHFLDRLRERLLQRIDAQDD